VYAFHGSARYPAGCMALYYLGEKVRNRVLSQSLSNQHISRATGLLWPVQQMLVKLTNQNKA